jgi:hypothetical protein
VNRDQFNAKLHACIFEERVTEWKKMVAELEEAYSQLVTIRDTLDALADKYPDVADSQLDEFFLDFYRLVELNRKT